MSNNTVFSGPAPTPEFLFDLLVRLLEDQEGVKITYELELGNRQGADSAAENHSLPE